MKAVQHKMIEAMKNEQKDELNEMKRRCKEFGVITGMPKGTPVEGRKKT